MTHFIEGILSRFGLSKIPGSASTGSVWYKGSSAVSRQRFSPVDGRLISEIRDAGSEEYETVLESACRAASFWRSVPAPKRGSLLLAFGRRLEEVKEDLGTLVSYEMGKSLQEGLGEVQEMIDICYFAQGLSRSLYGYTMPSERPEHRMMEQYHPLGLVGIISAFNFPVAVWSWNAALSWVCGNVCIWKPSEKTPLTAIACQTLISAVLKSNGYPEGISSLLLGDATLGKKLSEDPRIGLISATGSVRMGKAVSVSVAARLGKALLELGGNNAIILSEKADLKSVLPSIVFGTVGTAGQRCTTTRRLIVHTSIFDQVKDLLKKAYSSLRIGDPLDASNHVGPLIDETAVKAYLNALEEAEQQGAKPVVKGAALTGKGFESGCYVLPAILEAENHYEIVQTETFAPILYLIRYENLKEAIALQNGVPQGLSSSIMTLDLKEAEYFLSVEGSDCGIANVNIGTSGAEIGGAFGGEKETGGGRESGSDVWKAYMRRQTNTLNYGNSGALAQGIKFDI